MTRTKQNYNCNNSADDLGLTKLERQSAGAFHTPKKLSVQMAKRLYPKYIKCKTKSEIVEKFGEEGKSFLEKFNLLDPCCGTGNLLAAALNVYKWMDEEDIYGVDIEPRAIEFCIKKFPHGHFQVGDCLIDDLSDDNFWKQETKGIFGYYKAEQLVKARINLKKKKLKSVNLKEKQVKEL